MAEPDVGQGVVQRLTAGPEQPRLRMRHRLARLGAVRPRSAVLDPLFKIIQTIHPKADLDVIERAYQTAERLKNGEAIPENEYSQPMPFKIISMVDKTATCSKA